MKRLERLDNYLKKYGHISLEEIPDNEETEVDFAPLEYLRLLEKKLENYTYQEDYAYLIGIFPRLSFFLTYQQISSVQKKNIYELLTLIHEKLQILLIQKPGNIEKNNPAYLNLKDFIDQVEKVSLLYLYDFVDHYQGSHLNLMEYLIFDVKIYNLVEEAIKKYPYMVRLIDQEGNLLFSKIVEKYLEELKDYVSDKELKLNSSLVYYDQVLDLFIKNKKLNISMKSKIEILGKIDFIKNSINDDNHNDLTKRKCVFWLNNLSDKLENNVFEEPSYDYQKLCYKHDIKENFDQGIQSEAKRLYRQFDPFKSRNRTIINDEYIITIDGDKAEEIDDSLSIKKLSNGNYKIGVHIADPGGYIPQNSIIMDEIYKRTTSIYLSDKTIFMMPGILSKDILSLNEGEYRLATSYYFEVNTLGKIEDFYFFKSIVKVDRNATYHETDNFLKRGYADCCELDKTLELFSEINSKLASNFTLDEMYSLVNRTTQNVSNTNIIGNSKSSKIVETNMIMTNYLTAKHFNEKNLPFINRVHKLKPDYLEELERQKMLLKREDKDVNNVINYIEGIYPKAEYRIDITGHYGLGIPFYAHLTSPLRRSADVLNTSICIDQIYFSNHTDKELYKIEEFLKEKCDYINQKHPTIAHFEKTYEKEKIKQLKK